MQVTNDYNVEVGFILVHVLVMCFSHSARIGIHAERVVLRWSIHGAVMGISRLPMVVESSCLHIG